MGGIGLGVWGLGLRVSGGVGFLQSSVKVLCHLGCFRVQLRFVECGVSRSGFGGCGFRRLQV